MFAIYGGRVSRVLDENVLRPLCNVLSVVLTMPYTLKYWGTFILCCHFVCLFFFFLHQLNKNTMKARASWWVPCPRSQNSCGLTQSGFHLAKVCFTGCSGWATMGPTRHSASTRALTNHEFFVLSSLMICNLFRLTCLSWFPERVALRRKADSWPSSLG